MIAAVGGILIAFRQSTVVYNQFKLLDSIYFVVYSVVGGIGWVAGSLFGGLARPGGLISRLLDFLGDDADTWVFLVGGLLLLHTVIRFPNGLAEMHARAAQSMTARIRSSR